MTWEEFEAERQVLIQDFYAPREAGCSEEAGDTEKTAKGKLCGLYPHLRVDAFEIVDPSPWETTYRMMHGTYVNISDPHSFAGSMTRCERRNPAFSRITKASTKWFDQFQTLLYSTWYMRLHSLHYFIFVAHHSFEGVPFSLSAARFYK